ncbi:hypothetical protein [Paenibacillus humicola]|uniref:hypothetical protein n=1 Tax=Paenibacillus humicola TaxID=3110540 RepID=UPI00237ACADD|nr:hypothetical protein [Paenibacillus humicola]
MRTKKALMSKTALLAAVAALALTVQTGAAGAAAMSPLQTATHSPEQQNAAMAHYKALLAQPGQLPSAIVYLKKHIGELTAYQSTIMVLYLENALVKALPATDQRIGTQHVQNSIAKVYQQGDTFTTVAARMKDASVKALLLSAAASGYRLETAEGFFFPVVDYAAFKPFQSFVTADIQAYLDIMAVESEQPSVKDAGLMIGYQQIVNRALLQESFLKRFPNSNRAAKVNSLFKQYTILTFYGVNNTPLFDYETKTMQPNAKKGYSLMLQWHDPSSSSYLTLLQKFMNTAKANDYKLTAAMDKFRKTNIPNA